MASVITSYSIHYTKLYESLRLNVASPELASTANVKISRITSYNVCYTKLLRLNDQIDHDDASGDDVSLNIDSLGQYILYTATDGDGDHADVNFDGLINIYVENDVPFVADASGKVREAQLADGTAAIIGAVTATGNFFIDGNIASGADEPVTITINGQSIVSYNFV